MWFNGELRHVTIDISSMEAIITDLEFKSLQRVEKRATRVTPERLPNIWSIDIETVKRTIDLASQHDEHEGSDHLHRRYSTNDRRLRYKRI